MILLALLVAAQTPTDAAKVDKAKPQEAPVAAPVEAKDEFKQEAQVQGSGLFQGGNVEGLTFKAGGFYGARYGIHGARLDLGLGMTALSVDDELPAPNPANGFKTPFTTNLNTAALAKLRYDLFLGNIGSLYAAGMAFHDTAANLLVRMRADAGYRQWFFHQDKHALGGELGVVYTLDNAPFDGDTNGDGKVKVFSDDSRFENNGGVLGARFGLSYTNALLDGLALTQTAEVIPNLFPDVEAPFESARTGGSDNKLGLGEATIVALATTVTATLVQNLSVAGTVAFVYDNGAIARRNAYTNYDVSTSLQLQYTIF